MFGADTQLIADRTYFVVGDGAEVVASGGWSRRRTLYGGDQHKSAADPLLDPNVDAARIRAFFVHPSRARRGLGRMLFDACHDAARREGFRAFELGATLPGIPLYRALGFTGDERVDAVLPDGVVLPIVKMTRAIDYGRRLKCAGEFRGGASNPEEPRIIPSFADELHADRESAAIEPAGQHHSGIARVVECRRVGAHGPVVDLHAIHGQWRAWLAMRKR